MNWTKLYTKYKGLWITLKDDQITVISSAKTAVEALKKAQKKGFKNPILNRMPDEITAFVASI